MPRYCLRGRVRPDQVDEYRRVHAEVWPELLAALRDAGWRNYSLFVGEDGTLIGYVETDDADDLDTIQRKVQGPVNDRWQRSVAALFAGEGAPDQAWEVVPEVFHLA
ncbi:MAG: L-rhamnose mutarotase [Janthinobacterium lividum]